MGEYNPYVEDWHTGRLSATLFYYLALGLSEGIQQRHTKQTEIDANVAAAKIN